MTFNYLENDLVEYLGGLDNSMYFKYILAHFTEITSSGGLHLTKCQSDPTSHLTKCQTGPKSDLGCVHLIHQYTSVILSDGQPTAIGQSTSHLTKCQPNPKSDGEGGSGWYFVRWPVSQPASQPVSICQPSDQVSTWFSVLSVCVEGNLTKPNLTKCQPYPKPHAGRG